MDCVAKTLRSSQTRDIKKSYSPDLKNFIIAAIWYEPERTDKTIPKTKVVRTPVTWYHRKDTRNSQGVLQLKKCFMIMIITRNWKPPCFFFYLICWKNCGYLWVTSTISSEACFRNNKMVFGTVTILFT